MLKYNIVEVHLLHLFIYSLNYSFTHQISVCATSLGPGTMLCSGEIENKTKKDPISPYILVGERQTLNKPVTER